MNLEKYIIKEEFIEKLGKSISDYIENYTEIVSELEKKISEISESNLWSDMGVKESYVNTCMPYIYLYKNSIDIMKKYLEYYYSKTGEQLQLDKLYNKKVDYNE